MILISHRGNIDGPSKKTENTFKQINKCIKLGYNVEIDVWYQKNNFYLGHDEPLYKTNVAFLKHPKLWCHAKNKLALLKLQQYNIHSFWHQNDSFTLTSNKHIWCFPGILLKNSIIVLPEQYSITEQSIAKVKAKGVCSDYISAYKSLL